LTSDASGRIAANKTVKRIEDGDNMEISIKLDRPLAVIDLETTGLRPDLDRIVEIAILKIHPNGEETQYVRRINPQIAIPPEASAVHGIRDADVKNEPTFKKIAPEVAHILQGCDLAGFNISNFDLRMLQREFERADTKFSADGRALVDAKQIFNAKEPRDLEAACRFYLNEKHVHAHTALEDVRMTWRVINAQLDRYEDLPREPAGLNSIFNRSVDSEGRFQWKEQKVAFAFGKHQGRLLEDVAKMDAEYLAWMVEKGEFRDDVKQIALNALRGKFPRKAIVMPAPS
jgi:DNA polymerase-3 subunit epsilon